MDENPQAPATPMTGTRRTRSARRVAGLIAGLALAACSLGLICAGAFAAWARAEGTYIDLGAHGTYSTHRYAITTDSTDWSTTLLGWAGSVQLKVAPDDQQPIFVGVAKPDAVSRYLDGVAFTTISELPGPGVASTDHHGAAPATPPRTAVAWTAQAQGEGTQTLRWKATDGRQTAFAMNADGSRLVQVRIESAAVTLARMPWWVPVDALALGSLGLVSGLVVLRRIWRPRRA